MKKYKISAVHDNDLITFLDSIGLLKEINNKKHKCKVCDDLITLENFGCIYPEDDKIKFCCNKLECYEITLRFRGNNND